MPNLKQGLKNMSANLGLVGNGNNGNGDNGDKGRRDGKSGSGSGNGNGNGNGNAENNGAEEMGGVAGVTQMRAGDRDQAHVQAQAQAQAQTQVENVSAQQDGVEDNNNVVPGNSSVYSRSPRSTAAMTTNQVTSPLSINDGYATAEENQLQTGTITRITRSGSSHLGRQGSLSNQQQKNKAKTGPNARPTGEKKRKKTSPLGVDKKTSKKANDGYAVDSGDENEEDEEMVDEETDGERERDGEMEGSVMGSTGRQHPFQKSSSATGLDQLDLSTLGGRRKNTRRGSAGSLGSKKGGKTTTKEQIESLADNMAIMMEELRSGSAAVTKRFDMVDESQDQTRRELAQQLDQIEFNCMERIKHSENRMNNRLKELEERDGETRNQLEINNQKWITKMAEQEKKMSEQMAEQDAKLRRELKEKMDELEHRQQQGDGLGMSVETEKALKRGCIAAKWLEIRKADRFLIFRGVPMTDAQEDRVVTMGRIQHILGLMGSNSRPIFCSRFRKSSDIMQRGPPPIRVEMSSSHERNDLLRATAKMGEVSELRNINISKETPGFQKQLHQRLERLAYDLRAQHGWKTKIRSKGLELDLQVKKSQSGQFESYLLSKDGQIEVVPTGGNATELAPRQHRSTAQNMLSASNTILYGQSRFTIGGNGSPSQWPGGASNYPSAEERASSSPRDFSRDLVQSQDRFAQRRMLSNPENELLSVAHGSTFSPGHRPNNSSLRNGTGYIGRGAIARGRARPLSPHAMDTDSTRSGNDTEQGNRNISDSGNQN